MEIHLFGYKSISGFALEKILNKELKILIFLNILENMI